MSPAAAYITAGQDEPGYRNWYMASPRHRMAVTSFNNYLVTYGVGGIVPTWQLLRTATSWQRLPMMTPSSSSQSTLSGDTFGTRIGSPGLVNVVDGGFQKKYGNVSLRSVSLPPPSLMCEL